MSPGLANRSLRPAPWLKIQIVETNFQFYFLELSYENQFSRSKKGVIETVRPGTIQIGYFQQKYFPDKRSKNFGDSAKIGGKFF